LIAKRRRAYTGQSEYLAFNYFLIAPQRQKRIRLCTYSTGCLVGWMHSKICTDYIRLEKQRRI